jgi:hypothetical protein
MHLQATATLPSGKQSTDTYYTVGWVESIGRLHTVGKKIISMTQLEIELRMITPHLNELLRGYLRNIIE